MSDYFGALMRSSGLAVDGATPQNAAPPNTAELIEVDTERSVPATQQSPAPRVQHQPEPLHAAAVREPQPGYKPAAASVQPEAPSVETRVAVERQQDKALHKNAVPTAPPPLVPAASPSDHRVPTTPPLGHDVVRAVMQWVAADPQQAIAGATSKTRQQPLTTLDVADIDIPVVREPTPTPTLRTDAGPEVSLPVQTQTLEHTVTRTIEASVEAVENPPRPATAMPAQAAFSATSPTPQLVPSPRDELVEISIGAIHLRVEAPATQPLVRSLAPPAAAPRASAATTTPRSALARRALRRI